jgi:DNA replication protein DnaC
MLSLERQTPQGHYVCPFENCTKVLGSERLTEAALDRLTHRCHILETKGESYRLQDAKRRRRRND